MSGIILAPRKHRPNREHNAHTSQYPPLSGVCACFVLLVVLFLASLKIMYCKPYQLTQLKAISHYSCALSSMPDFSSQMKMFQLVRNAVQFARFARNKFEKCEVSCLLRHELWHFNQRTIPLLCWQVQAYFSQRLPRGSRCFVRCESSSRRLLAAAISDQLCSLPGFPEDHCPHELKPRVLGIYGALRCCHVKHHPQNYV